MHIKKLRKRLTVFLFFITVWILVDEYIKEGYLFNIDDILSPHITHEKIIITALIVIILLLMKQKK